MKTKLLSWLLLSTLAASAQTPCTLDRATATQIESKPFLAQGYGLRWNSASDRIVFMRPNSSGYYRLYTLSGAGGSPQELGDHGLPIGHRGAATWHPSGRYLAFVAQKADWKGRRLFGSPDYEALPGFGRHTDLWVSSSVGSHSWQLTHEANTTDQGVLIPIFSPNGHRIAWSSRQPGGKYILKVANFVDGPQPHLEDVRSFQPGGAAYYETGFFSSDGASLTYASDQDTHSFWHSQIYRLDLATGKDTRLTQGADYNEHPSVVKTPTGDWIVYMSTRGVNRFPGHLLLGTDWWAMRLDGSGAKRLTRMNVRRRDNPQNSGAMQVAGTVAVSPDGTFMLGDVQDSLTRQTGFVRKIHFVGSP